MQDSAGYLPVRVWRMRKATTIPLTEPARLALSAIVRDRNSPHKHVWPAQIVLLSAEGCGTMELTRRTGTSKTSVWRWQERFLAEGVPGLLRDETRPSRIPPLGTKVEARVVAAMQTPAPGETTHWTAGAMPQHVGISVALVHWPHGGRDPPPPSCYAVPGGRRMESGRPPPSIRFSPATPMEASVCCAAKPR